MVEQRHFKRIVPKDMNGYVISSAHSANSMVANLSIGGAKIVDLPAGLMGQVGQLYLPIPGYGEVFVDFRCLERKNGIYRLQFKNISYAEQAILDRYIDAYDRSLHSLAEISNDDNYDVYLPEEDFSKAFSTF